MSINLNYSEEYMDPEFGAGSLSIKGVKLDGNNGVKARNGLHQLKSTDYLVQRNGECIFIEFSDLVSQMSNLKALENRNAKDKVLQEYWLSKLTEKCSEKKLIKLINNIIRNELLSKIKDSLLLINWIGYNKCNTYVYYIVVKDFEHDSVIYLDVLKNEVKSALPSKMCKDIKILTLEKLVSILS